MQISKSGEWSLLLVATLTIMVGAALAPGLTSIADALGVTAYAPFLITLPALGAIIFAPLFGWMIDKFNPRKVLLLSLLGYFIFGCGGMFLHGPWAVTIDRILVGGFTAGAMASGTAIISICYAGMARLSMIAKQGMAIELGGVVLLFVSGLLSDISWRAPFLLYSLALVCFVLLWRFIPKQLIPASEPLTNPESLDSATPQAAGKTNSSMVSIFIFATLAMASFFSMFIILPSLLTVLGFTQSQVGYLLSFISFIAVLTALFMPQMVRRVGIANTLLVAFASFALAQLFFASSGELLFLILAAIFAGMGFGFSIPLLNHATVERSSEHNRGRNLSRFTMAVFSGQFITSGLEFLHLDSNNTLYISALVSFICVLLIIKNRTKIG